MIITTLTEKTDSPYKQKRKHKQIEHTKWGQKNFSK